MLHSFPCPDVCRFCFCLCNDICLICFCWCDNVCQLYASCRTYFPGKLSLPTSPCYILFLVVLFMLVLTGYIVVHLRKTENVLFISVQINNARVISADNVASNGVLHIIDAILMWLLWFDSCVKLCKLLNKMWISDSSDCKNVYQRFKSEVLLFKKGLQRFKQGIFIKC